MENGIRTIFMTGGGGSGTIAAAGSLKKTGRYRIILGDMDKWAAGLRFADKAYVLPGGKDPGFLETVRGIIIEEKVDVFVPLVDEELLVSYALKDEFPDLKILLPEERFTRMALDKWVLMKSLYEKGFPCPETHLASESGIEMEYPFIVKPRVGRGSRLFMEIPDKEHLKAYKVISRLPDDQILLQEKIKGKEYTVSVVVNELGRVLAVVPKEIIYKKGITISAVTRKNVDIQDICLGIQENLKANGPFNVQLFVRDDGRIAIFEINPRFSTTIALTIAAGINEIDMLIEDKKGIGPIYPFEESLVMSRFYDQVYFEEK